MSFSFVCYRLVKVKDENDDALWFHTSPNVCVYLQFACRFGMMTIKKKCSCCNFITHHNIFFTLAHTDHTFHKCMRPRLLEDGDLKLYLPGGTRGLFKIHKRSEGFNDTYILRNVVCANDHDPHEHTLIHFFENITLLVQRRAVFRRLRAFSRRTRTMDERTIVNYVLDHNGIHEVGIHIRIMRLAHFW